LESTSPGGVRADTNIIFAFAIIKLLDSNFPLHSVLNLPIENIMNQETIKVRVTESGQTMDVVVFSMRADRIEVVIGEGAHNIKCELKPRLETDWLTQEKRLGGKLSTREAAKTFRPRSTNATLRYKNQDDAERSSARLRRITADCVMKTWFCTENNAAFIAYRFD